MIFTSGKDYPDSVYQAIINSPLRPSRDYKYSDMGFIYYAASSKR